MKNPLTGLAAGDRGDCRHRHCVWRVFYRSTRPNRRWFCGLDSRCAIPIDATGLFVKWPFVDSVIYIDKRILDLDETRQEVLVADNQRLEVDAFMRYRISDALKFYQSVGSIPGANAQLGGMLNSALRADLGRCVDHRHRARQARRADGRNSRSGEIGRPNASAWTVVDVRIKRADLPPENSEAVFHRMQTERQQRAAKFRAQGSQQSQQIKAEADRQVTVTIAEGAAGSRPDQGPGRRRTKSHLCRELRQGPRFFRVLPIDAGL